MNNEIMIPFILYVLYSDDLKKQSDRIIQELKSSNDDVKASADGFIASLSDTEWVKSHIQSQHDQLAKVQDIQTAVHELKKALNNEEIMLSIRDKAENYFHEIAEELMLKQEQVSENLFKKVSQLDVKIKFIDKLENIDKIVNKLDNLERMVLSLKKGNTTK